MLKHEKQIKEYEEALEALKKQSEENKLLKRSEIQKLEKKLVKLKNTVYSKLTAWQRVEISRHPERPNAKDFIVNICESFKEVFGDRLYQDDHAIITGFGIINGQKVAIVAQEKGKDTETRLYRNFGMPYPEGYRKALRIMKLAEKFAIPVITIIDTPGAYAGLAAEERGQGWAIAENLLEMSKLKTPIVSIVIGEGCSGGALGIGVADKVAMLEHAYYTVISPEGCASILWRDAQKKDKAAETLKMHAENLQQYGIIDDIIEEPQGGAHHDQEQMYERVKEYISSTLPGLLQKSPEVLCAHRYEKFRAMGVYEESN